MCGCERIFLDGTFNVAPKLFSQLYTIHGLYTKHGADVSFCIRPFTRQIENYIYETPT